MTTSFPVGQCRDADGFISLEHYGLIGDGRGVALVAIDGVVDWWAVPRLDDEPAFAALLDPASGGRFLLRPTETTATARRRYLPDTNVLETTFTTPAGVVAVVDCLNFGNAGALPWSELARRVTGVEGEVEFELSVAPGTGLGRWQPWAQDDPRGALLDAGDTTFCVRCCGAVTLDVGERDVTGPVRGGSGRPGGGRSRRGERPAAVPGRRRSDRRTHRPDGGGLAALGRAGRLAGGPARSGRAECVGAEAAADVADRGDRRGGDDLVAGERRRHEELGLPILLDPRRRAHRRRPVDLRVAGEVHADVCWLLRTVRRHGPDVHVMYTLDGDLLDTSRHAPVPGYRGSSPMMIGNDAVSQVQLGIYGDLFGTVAAWVCSGHVLDVRSARELADPADRCADVWQYDDARIWELQDDRPYTSSKMNCWRALELAARLADDGHLTGRGHRWRAEAARIHVWVNEHCWSERKQAYTFFAGSDALDASVLLGAGLGFDTGDRMSSTTPRPTRLADGPLVYRYSGVHREEQTFVACAYWLVSTLAWSDASTRRTPACRAWTGSRARWVCLPR